jgi:hypothetical protein
MAAISTYEKPSPAEVSLEKKTPNRILDEDKLNGRKKTAPSGEKTSSLANNVSKKRFPPSEDHKTDDENTHHSLSSINSAAVGVSRATVPPETKEKRRRKRRTGHDDFDYGLDDESDHDRDDEDHLQSIQKSSSKEKSVRGKKQPRGKMNDHDDDDEDLSLEDDNNDDDSDFVEDEKPKQLESRTARRNNAPTRKAIRSSAKKGPKKRKEDLDDFFIESNEEDFAVSEEEESEIETPIHNKSSRVRRDSSMKKKKSSWKLKNDKKSRKTKEPSLDDFVVDEESEEYEQAENDLSTPAFRRSRRSTASKTNFKEDSSAGVDEYLDDEDASVQPYPRGAKGNKRDSVGRSARNSTRRNLKDDSSSEFEESKKSNDLKGSSKTKGNYGNPASFSSTRAATSKRRLDLQDSDDSDHHKIHTTSSRRKGESASRASQKLASLLHDTNESDNDEDAHLHSKIGQRKGVEDEEFKLDEQNEESSISSENDLVVDKDDEIVASTKSRVSNVDADDSFLDADESDDDDERAALRHTPPSLKIVRSRAKKALETYDKDELDCSDEEEMDQGSNEVSALASPHMPFCGSKEDVVTLDPLPEKHVCFFSPDGKSRQCFALETLHKIALSGTPFYSNDGRMTFKQPPHFRTTMSDDLIDQIASRFGRAALDLHGYFYRPDEPLQDGPERRDYDYIVHFGERLADDDEFNDRFNSYLSRCMGSADIRVCPVCYTEAHRRLDTGLPDDDDDANEDDTEPIDGNFRADPMTVLRYMDNSGFELASAFCFRKLVEVKSHLRNDHSLDTSNIDGNDLYKRFMIRAPDGLLQRFLEKRKHSNQGAMSRYWRGEGNSELFIYLLELMDRRECLLGQFPDEPNAKDAYLGTAREFYDDVQAFWSSFAIRGHRIWDVISEPYLKGSQEEIDDFVDDTVEEGNNPIHYHLIDRARDKGLNPEDEIVSSLRNKRGKSPIDGSDSEHGDEESDDLQNSDDDGHIAQYYSEEEEMDEWEANLRNKGKARINERVDRLRRRRASREVEVGPKVLSMKKTAANDSQPASVPPAFGLIAKKRRIILDDESEDE